MYIMGFFSDVFDGFKNTIGKIVNTGANIIGKAGDAFNWVKNGIGKARNFIGNIPLVGGLANQMIYKVANAPLMDGMSFNDMANTAENTLNQARGIAENVRGQVNNRFGPVPPLLRPMNVYRK